MHRSFPPLYSLPLLVALAAAAEKPIDIGSRRELFVDDWLIAQRDGVELRLHPPQRRESAFTFNAAWEGTSSNFFRVIRVGDVIRLYYMSRDSIHDGGLARGSGDTYACVIESIDGIHWVRPDLQLFAFHGSKHNNITWTEPGIDVFTPFRDTNPAAPPDERFKATLVGGPSVLWALKSPDGFHWSRLSDRPIITHGRFDTQNDAFWDPVRKQYWCYIRGLHDRHGRELLDRDFAGPHPPTDFVRDIRVATSKDFRHWTDPRPLRYVDSPDEELYTNQIEPYYRAPDLFVGFPTRYVDRKFSPAALQALPDPVHRGRRMKISSRFGTAITDGQFMTSRDGITFHRWDEDFIPPGPERSNNWIYGDGYQSLGLLQTPAQDPTAPPELSCYAFEGRFKEGETMRRYTLRIDGFVSLHARQAGGEFTTKPMIFSGKTLTLNFATSAAGSIRIEVESPDGTPLPGRSAADCDDLFGDTLDRTVTWHDRSDLGSLAGHSIRLRLVMCQADLYSLKFQD